MWEKVGNKEYVNNIHLNEGGYRAFFTEIKNKGKHRKIFILDKESNLLFKKLVKKLSQIYSVNNKANISHSFIKGRSPLTNARQHVGFDVTISMDITNFFDNIRPSLLKEYLPQKYIDSCFIDNALPQGFPTSPVLSNIAMIDFDTELQSCLFSFYERNKDVIARYKITRYADDIVISFKLHNYTPPKKNTTNEFKHIGLYNEVQVNVENLMFEYGFSVNKNKTKLQFSRSGQRIVTGVSVGISGMKATRKIKRKLRAALHQVNIESAVGIERWIIDCEFDVND
ncbi:RNA-directed DNA polymerase [Vibrio crassostreae]|nr:RNA-directed DNA polymerase [Vibrio crassostreae]CAK1714805.1 RNA-directed DNA polymerase [Vibrio crassostreae]CAK2534743.1 RNA-directed DNA polymerase [Vibrio crassostreae]CAK2540062.1 RNA-directed DNA polymerase [Vibrio crassostreae]CAK2594262.1 RNA-directed DNA polymerase [Vibrio crassostreae]